MKTITKLTGIAALAAACFFFTVCASMDETDDESVQGMGLMEAIEQSAEKICADIPEKTSVAIVAWESSNENLSDYVMEELMGELFDRGIEIADRQNLEYIYNELKLQMSGDVSDETAKSIGKFVGADMVIVGQLLEVGSTLRFRVNALDTENATRKSMSRYNVSNNKAMQNFTASLATMKTVTKTARYANYDKEGSTSYRSYIDRGLLFLQRGDYTTALLELNEAIRLEPDKAAGYANRAIVYSSDWKKDYDAAIADYNKAIGIDGANAMFYLGRGVVYDLYKKDHDKGIADFTQAIRTDPDLADAYWWRASAYEWKNDHDQAVRDYTQAVKLRPDHARTYSARARIYEKLEKYDLAIADYTQLIRVAALQPEEYMKEYSNSVGYGGRASAYAEIGDYNKAAADYTQLINGVAGPSGVGWGYSGRGYMYAEMGDYTRAIADFTQLINGAGGQSNVAGGYYGRGSVYLDRKDYNRAIADFEQALKLDPDNYSYKMYLDRARREQ